MIKILLVDDDAVVADIYVKKLRQQGFDVMVALDGLEAMKTLSSYRPNLVILDIMMPRFNGLEVLDFIRARPELAHTKVIVLSNFYISGDQRRAATTKADREFVKSSCTPQQLLTEIAKLLGEGGDAPLAEKPATATAPVPFTESVQNESRVRQEFIANAPTTMATLRQMNAAFVRAESPKDQAKHLLEFYRKIHYTTAMAGMAGCQRVAMLSNAFEALLLELHEKPQNIGPSTLQTVAFTLDFLALLMGQAQSDTALPLLSSKAAVVDDDPISARAVGMALQRINFEVTSYQDPLLALKGFGEIQFDLIMLDVLMPGMDGMELCKRTRALPQYKKTPIIFVTGHADFQKRVQSVLSGGNDLIAKPIFPIELAVKAVTQLLKSQVPGAL